MMSDHPAFRPDPVLRWLLWVAVILVSATLTVGGIYVARLDPIGVSSRLDMLVDNQEKMIDNQIYLICLNTLPVEDRGDPIKIAECQLGPIESLPPESPPPESPSPAP